MSGQPRVEKGQSAELNQVSSTSSSRLMLLLWQAVHSVGSSLDTMVSRQSSQYHAGTRWPHHIWRVMHQSCMSRIQAS